MVNNRGRKRVNFHTDCSHTNVIEVKVIGVKSVLCVHRSNIVQFGFE